MCGFEVLEQQLKSPDAALNFRADSETLPRPRCYLNEAGVRPLPKNITKSLCAPIKVRTFDPSIHY